MSGGKRTKYLVKVISGDPIPLVRGHTTKVLEIPFMEHQFVQLKGRIAILREGDPFTIEFILIRKSIRAGQEG